MIVLKILGIAILAVLAAVVLYLAFLGIIALLVDPKKEYTTHSRFYRTMLNLSTAIVFWFGRVHITVNGREKLPKDSRFLLVSNHKSNYDPLITWLAFKEFDLSFISKEANFKIPFFGRMIRKCCFLGIDRENARKAMETIAKATALLENDTVNMAAYPEGTRNKAEGYELLPFRPGLFKIAQKAHVPMVVITIKGTRDIRYFFKSSQVVIDVLEVIPADEVAALRTAELSDRIAKEMAENLAK